MGKNRPSSVRRHLALDSAHRMPAACSPGVLPLPAGRTRGGATERNTSMSDFDRNYAATRRFGADRAEAIDAGLRAHMVRVYNYMAAGLALTGLVALATYALAVTGDPASAVARAPGGIMLTSFGYAMFASPL